MAIVNWNRWNQIYPSIFDDGFLPQSIVDSDAVNGLNMYETDNALVIEAQVPGVDENNLNVLIEDNILTISADYKESNEEKERKKVVYKSSRQMSFRYSTTLPRKVDTENTEAVIENGVVTVTIPKIEEAKPRKITINKKK